MIDTLVAYGHSWIACDGASTPSLRFVNVVAGRLGLRATNLGVGGSGSSDTAASITSVPPPTARMFLLMTGLNDARLGGDLPRALDAYTSSLDTILAALGARQRSALVVAIEQPHLADYALHAPHDHGSDAAIDAFNARLRLVAARRPRVVVAVPGGWDAERMLADDTVHPNDAGHAELARCVIAAVLTPR